MEYIPIHFDEYLRSKSQSSEKNAKVVAFKSWLENGHLRLKTEHLDYMDFGYKVHFFPLDSQGKKLQPMSEEDFVKLEECDRVSMRRSEANDLFS